MTDIDYWSKLKLNECWSEKKRFNIMMNYIMSETETPTGETEPLVEEPEEEETTKTGNISVLVTDNEGKAIGNADVSVYDKGEPYEGTTGNAGGCTIRDVPYGDYTIEAVAEGYDFTVETITVNQEEQEITLVLLAED